MEDFKGTGKITVDFGNLFIRFNYGGANETILPITAIKAMENDWGRVKLHLKEEYCYDGRSYVMVDNMSLEQLKNKINETIISALKESIK